MKGKEGDSMAQAAEIEFFGQQKDGGAANRRPASSIKGMQRAISKLDPQLLKTVITSCGGSGEPSRLPLSQLPTPKQPSLSRSPKHGQRISPAPLTIFYDGKVNVFFLRKDLVEEIIRWAESTDDGWEQEWMLTGDNFRSGISSARRNSLQRFLRKRQQR